MKNVENIYSAFWLCMCVRIYIYTHWGLEVSKKGIFAGGKDTPVK